MQNNLKLKFGKEYLDVSFKAVFSVVKLMDSDLPPVLKYHISKELLGWKKEESFEKWLDYISGGSKSSAPNSGKATMNIVHDIKRIRSSIMMLWRIDIMEKPISWHEVVQLIEDSVLMKSPIAEVVKIRNYDTTKVKDPQEKYAMMKAKQMFALPPRKGSSKQSTADLFNSLAKRAKRKK